MMESYMVNLRMVVEKFMFRKTLNISDMENNFTFSSLYWRVLTIS